MDDNCGEWVECMGVASGCGEQEVGVASGSGWNLWVWLLGVVLRRYIDFLILLIPTPLVSVLFCSSIPTFLFIKKNVFTFFIYTNITTADLLGTNVVLHSLVIVQPLLGAKLCPLLHLLVAVCGGAGPHEAAQVGQEQGLVWNTASHLEQLQATRQARIAAGPQLLHLLWVCRDRHRTDQSGQASQVRMFRLDCSG